MENTTTTTQEPLNEPSNEQNEELLKQLEDLKNKYDALIAKNDDLIAKNEELYKAIIGMRTPAEKKEVSVTKHKNFF